MRKVRVVFYLPDFVCRLADSILQIYRRFWYGYPFRLIPLTRDKFAVVDPDDYPSLAMHTWSLIFKGNTYYAARFTVESDECHNERVFMHRQVMNSPKDFCVDHINGNGLDNRKANLRIATIMQNSWNRKKQRGNFTSRFKGASWHKIICKWQAKITCRERQIFLGYYDVEEDAARAYDAKARELFGQFAKLNFPPQ